METQNPKTKRDLKQLRNYLQLKKEEEKKEVKPEQMTFDEMESFFNNTVKPAFNTLKEELKEYSFEAISIEIHVKKAILRVADKLTHFIFKIEIDNTSREIKIYYKIKHRLQPRKKLLDLEISESEDISFKEIEKITPYFIISVFTGWFIKKDELISKFEEFIRNKTNAD